jgi:hypothetical protein
MGLDFQILGPCLINWKSQTDWLAKISRIGCSGYGSYRRSLGLPFEWGELAATVRRNGGYMAEEAATQKCDDVGCYEQRLGDTHWSRNTEARMDQAPIARIAMPLHWFVAIHLERAGNTK